MFSRSIGQHIAVTLGVFANDDNASFIGVLTRTRRRIDRHNNSRQVWRCRLSRGIDDAVAPQRARGVLEQFGIELLPAEARPFVFADDLVEEPGRQICAIFIGRAPRYRNITAFAGE